MNFFEVRGVPVRAVGSVSFPLSVFSFPFFPFYPLGKKGKKGKKGKFGKKS